MRGVSTLVFGLVLCASVSASAQDQAPGVADTPAERTDPAAEREDTQTDAVPPPAPGAYVSSGAIVGFIASGVGLVTFVVAGALAIDEDQRLREECPGRCFGRVGDDLRTYALLSDLGLGLTFVGAALGVLFLLADPGPERSEVVSITPLLDRDGGGLLVRGRL